MELTKEQLQKLKDQVKNIKFMQPGEVSDTGEVKNIKFTTEEQILEAFYLNLRNRDKAFWTENRDILELIKNHIRNNINRHKLNKGD